MNRKPPSAPDATADPAWQAETESIRPLSQRGKHSRHRFKPAQPPQETFVAPQWAPRHTPLAILSREAACIAGIADGLDKKLLKDLAVGKPVFSAVLDLHGMQEGDAWLKLMDWLTLAADNDHRCVLVITGKGSGYGPAGDMGVIKAQAAQWLAGHPKVMAFHTAMPKDGGTGALYVLLKRRR